MTREEIEVHAKNSEHSSLIPYILESEGGFIELTFKGKRLIISKKQADYIASLDGLTADGVLLTGKDGTLYSLGASSFVILRDRLRARIVTENNRVACYLAMILKARKELKELKAPANDEELSRKENLAEIVKEMDDNLKGAKSKCKISLHDEVL